MKRLSKYLLTVIIFGVAACGGEQPEGVEGKKEQLKAYKTQINELQGKITALEQEIAAEDPAFAASNKNATLITTIPVKEETFAHYIQVRGNVASDRNVTVGAEASGEVTRVNARKGDKVRKGQLLIVQNAETAKNGLEELKTSLELAKTKYERQANLWEKKIGTEMQYLESKNNVESLERRISSAQSQLNNYFIYAPFGGTIDEVIIKEGETAQPGVPLLRLVSLEDMYILADVSESYLGQFNRGDSVEVNFPSLNKTIKSTIGSVGQVINPNNRTFEVEVKLPNDENLLRPNLLAVLKIKDFEAPNSVVLPSNLIQSDNRGDYVYTAKKDGEDLIAEKKRVERGMTYSSKTMIKSGLQPGEVVINEGYREVSEGVAVKLADQNNVTGAMSAK